MDVKTAFLNGVLREEVYALRAWYDLLSKFLLSQQFSKGAVDPTLFTRKEGKDILMVQIYVDDIIFASTDPSLCDIFADIMSSNDPVDTPMIDQTKLDEDLQGHPLMLPAKPTEKHLHAVKWIFRYLRAYTDADHAGCQDTRRSTSGSAQFLEDRLVSWSLKKQKSTSLSSTEAEYIALSGCFSQILWMRSQQTYYGFDSTKSLCNDHFIKEQVKNGVVEIYFVRTEYQLADIFTKALPRERFEFLINKLEMKSMSPETFKSLTEENEK
ncbi:retrovirus-related pol polyprotein from transposon TNT 1-94 [Tanacetum coccineum]